MLRAKQVEMSLLREGAKRRLAELNAEREVLLTILGENKPKPKKRTGKPHWTRTAAGRAKMSQLMKDKYANGWKGHKKDAFDTIPNANDENPTAEQQITSALPETDGSTH